MTKQDKIKKVMDEFKRGTLKTPDGKVVKSRKQALAIAMSESENYAEKGDLINHLSVNSIDEALDILKAAGTEDLFEKAKHQDGDMHPNGKWVWVASAAGGKGDWRTMGGRAHKKSQAGTSSGSGNTATTASTKTKPAAKTQATVSQTTNSSESKKNKLTPKQQKIVDGFMDKVKTSDSRYSDPSKVTLWKTPKGNWYVKYDGHQVATIAPSGLTEKIAEAAGMKIDREPSSYQSSKTKKSTTPKTDKERLDLQQEYATMSQLIKKPSTSAQHKKEFQERMKEIEGMGLKVVKGKFQWSDTGTAATPKSTSSKQDIFDSNGTTVLGSANRILFVKQLSEDLRKKLSSLPVIRIDDDGLQPGDIRNGAAKTPEQQNNLRELIDEGVLVTVKKNGRISGYTLNKNYDFSKKSTKQKKLRPVGTDIKISTYNSGKTPTSASNYISLTDSVRKELKKKYPSLQQPDKHDNEVGGFAKRVIKTIFQESSDVKEGVKNLNESGASPYYRWSVKEENDDYAIISAKGIWGGTEFIRIDKSSSKTKTPTKEKKLRPVGTGTLGPERRRKK